jgi:hypothetical protein
VTCSEDHLVILWKIEDDNYEKIIVLSKINNSHDRPIYYCSLNYEQNLLATVIINFLLIKLNLF